MLERWGDARLIHGKYKENGVRKYKQKEGLRSSTQYYFLILRKSSG